ncbi:hypothetical protein NECAME_04794 [Necator americanus]|uniref:Uncharacterized protein n=1 Tax=Necator americanus TaxID=51031 RepID=W2SPM1_NECAM|nr:hypothetical protein NECAME_04794 [Necator americanus]ETN70781.1 hypothetical protein NECAME_04794 [Necator americanus]
MALLKTSLRLLEAIEQGEYEKAFSLTENASQQHNSSLSSVAPDLIYKVAYSFGNQNNSQLKVLLIRLFDLLTSVPQKYRICYELLTLRTSPFLTDVLVNQLGSLITKEFLESYPDLWNQICSELPVKLEKRLCQRFTSVDEELWLGIIEAANVLAFFDKIPFKVPYKFGQLVDVVLNEMAAENVDETAAFRFLIWHAREHPFSPKLLGHTEPTVLIPNVYDLRYLRLRLTEGICDYISASKHRCDGAFVKPLANALRFLHKLCDECQEIHATHIDIYAGMFVLLVRFMENFDLEVEGRRFVIMDMSQNIIACFQVELRVLLLKRIIGRIINGTHLYVSNKAKILAWLLDQLELILNEKICVDELGSVFGLLENVSYDDVPTSLVYYTSVLRIIKAYARECANIPMLAEARERLVVRVRNELTDYLQCDHVDGKIERNVQEKQGTILQPLCSHPLPGEESLKQLHAVLEDCEQTISDIDEVLTHSRQLY